jgi:hypothetical protein
MDRRINLLATGLGALIMQMSTEERNKTIKDLTNKYPTGPDGCNKKCNYEMQHVYHDIYGRYTDVPVLYIKGEEIAHFGYDPIDLFMLKITDENDAIKAVREAYAPVDISRRQAVRRGRVLWYRVRAGWKQTLETGGVGVYELKWGWRYNAPRAFVHAENHEDAISVGLTLNGLFGAQIGERAQSTFLEVGAPVATLSYNNEVAQTLVRNAERALQEAKKSLETAQNGIKNAQSRAELIMANAMMQANLHEDTATG